MTTIVFFMFNYRGEEFKHGEFQFGFELECKCETGMFGSIDFGCSSTRCQCYQHKWLFLLVVMYSTIL